MHWTTDDAATVGHGVDEPALVRLAALLAGRLPSRAFVALRGDLGAGKTTFVKGAAAALGLDPADVISPTFGLIHEHACAAGRLVHADLYRLASAADLAETGWDDAVASGRVFAEWPERITAALPADRLELAIAIETPATRRVTLVATGPVHAAALEGLPAAMAAGIIPT